MKFGHGSKRYVSQQMEFNKDQRKSDRIRGRGLLETEIKAGKLEKDGDLDVDAELNEMHGLCHLQASDEELFQLLCVYQ